MFFLQVFLRDEVMDEETGAVRETLIRVTNTKLNISAFWTLDKFEEKLLQMRELYQGEAAYSPEEEEALFYDPSDKWENEDRSFNAGNTPLSVRMSPSVSSAVSSQLSPGIMSPSM